MALSDTPAGYIIEYLKGVATTAVAASQSATNNIANSASSGPAMVPGVLPALLADISALPAFPALPTPPTFPTMPAELKLDSTSLRAGVAADVLALKASWMATYLPTTVDTSQFDALAKDMLNGVNTAQMTASFNQLEADLLAALGATLLRMNTELATNITASKAALALNVAGLQPKIDAATALAIDQTSNIAWARARGQAAREAARLEAESISALAARGFALPNGVLTAQQQAQRQATQSAASAMAAEQAVRTQQQFLDIAKIAISGWLDAAKLQLESELGAYKTISETQLRGAAQEMEAYRGRAKQAMDNLGLRLEFTKASGELAVKHRGVVLDAMNGLINAYANIIGSSTNYAAKISEAQRGILAAFAQYIQAAVSAADITLKPRIANNENQLKYADIAARFMVGGASNYVHSAVAVADQYAKVAGMALGGLNGIGSVVTQE